MRLAQYLNEKWTASIDRGYGETIEIFLNPSKKEIKEVTAWSGFGYRFLIDFKNKEFYVWTDSLFHEPVMEFLKKEGDHRYVDESRTRFDFGSN